MIWQHPVHVLELHYSVSSCYLSDNSRQQLFLEAVKRDGEVDDVDLDVDSGEVVWVGYRRRHV